MKQALYNVFCIAGHHALIAPKGSELERRCQSRQQEGKLDALAIKECEACAEDAARHAARVAFYLEEI